MRAPFQVLVIPFRRTPGGTQFAVLRRSDTGWWQFVSGGGEDQETPAQLKTRLLFTAKAQRAQRMAVTT